MKKCLSCRKERELTEFKNDHIICNGCRVLTPPVPEYKKLVEKFLNENRKK